MFGEKHRHLNPLPFFLVWLVFCGGCASLKPSASETAPEFEGGLKISDESRSALGVFGTCLYYVGQFFAGGSCL